MESLSVSSTVSIILPRAIAFSPVDSIFSREDMALFNVTSLSLGRLHFNWAIDNRVRALT